MSEARGGSREELPRVRGAVAEQAQEGLRSHPTLKVRNSGGKEIPVIQGKEQWLCFAGATMKRYPKSKARETQLRQ